MATLNVFELTNQELRKDETQTAISAKKLKESVSKKSKKVSPFAIPVSKLKRESLSKFRELLEDENVDELDVTADYTPEDDVVLVIDPDMEDVPEDVEEAEEAAEDLIGNHVCKCAICGANYVTDEELSEDLDVVDETCPVCGEEGDQIVVGVITATEELSDEDKADIDDVDVEDEVEEKEEVEETEDGDFEEFEEEEDDEDFEESVRRSRMRTMRRKAESIRKTPLARKPSAKRPAPVVKESSEDPTFDEVTFNRMLTTFAKENYSNVKFVKISKGSVRGKKMTLEGVVTTTKGSKRPIKFVCENFEMGRKMTLRFKEYGPFTESVKTEGSPFVVECVSMKGRITPVSLRYSYKAKNAGMKESKNLYSVTGKVLSESVRRAPKRIKK